MVVTDTANVLGELTPISNPSGDVTLDNRTPVVVSGTSVSTADIGYAPPAQTAGDGLIGDTVFLDRDASGSFNAGEGLEGVTVGLYTDLNGDGNPADGQLLQTTASNENGQYFFGGLGTGNYVVQVDTTTLPGTTGQLTNTVDPNTASPGDNRSAVTLTAGALVNLTQDFGYRDLTSPNSISGTVWRDTDADGTLDESLPANALAGVTVVLLDPSGRIVGTTTTAGDGTYAFNNLPNGTYTVDVTDDANVLAGTWHSQGTDSEPDPTASIVLSGPTNANADFGYYVTPAAIGDFVWSDLNGNGIQDGSEPGLDGQLVTLTITYPGGAGTTTVVAVTGDDPTTAGTQHGWYNFGNLLTDENFDGVGAPEPTYVLSVGGPAGYVPSPPNQGADTVDSDLSEGQAVTLVAGQTDTSLDFGFVPLPASIADGASDCSVWLDENGNGIRDAGEDGIPNVTVTLKPPLGVDIGGGSGGSITTVTGTDGTYIFKDLPAGTYTVTVTRPTGLNPTYDPPPPPPPDGIGTPDTTSRTLAAGEEGTGTDFGYNWVPSLDSTGPIAGTTGAIGDRLWIDVDNDGVQDAGEPGLMGVEVRLFADNNGDGIYETQVGATQTTGADGRYVFIGVAPGAYRVVVNGGAVPGGYALNSSGDPDGLADNRTLVVLAPGDVFVNADFGYVPDAGTYGTVNGTVWFDADADQTGPAGTPAGTPVDADEYGIPGVVVSLIQDSDGDGTWDAGEPIIATTVTDGSGNYAFVGLPADAAGTYDYLVWVSDTGNVLGNLDPTYDSNTIATPNVSAATNLVPAGNADQDFGYTAPGQTMGNGLIGDAVFLDRDGSGDLSSGEGLEGVRVRLYDAAGAVLLATAYTDENGHYYFGGLSTTGTYTVRVDTTTLPGAPGDTPANTVDPDGTEDNTTVVTLTLADPVNLSTDFGYEDPANLNTIAGTIWQDNNADGTRTEPGRYANVTVTLYDDGGNIVGTTLTNGTGQYSFPNVPNGTYTVDVTDEQHVLRGTWHTLGTNSLPDPDTVILSGNTNATVDFGYYKTPAALGDFVWNDANHDGIQDPNPSEAGLANVTVTLTIAYPNSDVTHVVTTTDLNGYYHFPNLLSDESFNGSGTHATPGVIGGDEPTYVLTVTTPFGFIATLVGQGSDSTKDSNDPTGTAPALVSGQTDDSNDFGFGPALALSADLKITKTGLPNPVLAGHSLAYEIVVTNLGPNDVTGATVADALPGVLTNVTWNATGSGGATNVSGSVVGHLFSATANLPVLSTLTYTIHATVAAGTTGSLSNTATVTAPAGIDDSYLLNNTDDAETLLGQLIDNDDPSGGFSRLGNWTLGSPCAGFFGDDVVYTPPGSGAVATWTFSGLIPGQAYEVATTWYSPPEYAFNRSTAAPFTISGGAASWPATVNQRLNPTDFSYLGSMWEVLSYGYIVGAGGTLTVTLGSAPDGYCLGDTILVQQVPAGLPAPPPAPAPVAGPQAPTGSGEAASPAAAAGSNLVPSFADARIMDNGDAGYRTSGRWSTVVGTGYQSVVQSIACTSCGDSFATWQFDNLSPWLTYQVYATWVAGPDRNAHAEFRLYQDVTAARNMTTRVQVNQQQAPADLTLDGVTWGLLGELRSDRGTLSVQLTNAGHGSVVADAILVVPLVPSPDPRLTVLVDGQTVAPGAATVDFGIAAAGTSQQKRLVLRNTGNGSLTLGDALAVPDGFELSDFPATQLAPGQFTTVTLTHSASAPRTLQGTLTLPTNDPAASRFSLQVTGDVVDGFDAAAEADAAQGPVLTAAMTQRLVAAAVDRWLAAGMSPAQAAAIKSLPFQVRDLPGDMLCAITPTRILIDTDAAGRSWFVDASPWEDAEFVAGTRPTGIDLLTVLTHEVGRQLGLTSSDGPAGGGSLTVLGTMPAQARRVPSGVFLVGQNPVNPLDVDNDDRVIPLDVLRLISRINAGGSPLTAVEPGVAAQFFDVTGDDVLSPSDVLSVINFLNTGVRIQAAGEASAPLEVAASRLPATSPVPFRETAGSLGPYLKGSLTPLAAPEAGTTQASPASPSASRIQDSVQPTAVSLRRVQPLDAVSIVATDEEWDSLLDLLARDALASGS